MGILPREQQCKHYIIILLLLEPSPSKNKILPECFICFSLAVLQLFLFRAMVYKQEKVCLFSKPRQKHSSQVGTILQLRSLNLRQSHPNFRAIPMPFYKYTHYFLFLRYDYSNERIAMLCILAQSPQSRIYGKSHFSIAHVYTDRIYVFCFCLIHYINS